MTNKDRQDLGLELLPYVKPKMKSVEMKTDAKLTVSVNIGGEGAG